ncbi:helix-turn-helix domain-containing protein [Amycolatopsis palatopharyngis]|uniref:helix-turn-helix domain-containing protein n=1 Tax=Amycolatopsis palatopharyngis TaxID=187982 RepID=UPI000E26666A|nr:helix-turn-helix transcriptional regulator [Amycolatopsis palatopharyngis]
MSGNLAKARQIGAELRKLRVEAGFTGTDVAEALGVQPSTITRWEKGERKQQPEDVKRYLLFVKAPEHMVAELVELAEADDTSPWLAVGLPGQRRQLDALLKVEATATSITAVSPLLVPGLLQTGEYARAIMRKGKVPERELHTRVAVRIGRRDAITRSKPAHLTALIGEMVLTQNIGGREVMLGQLRSLLDAAKMPNVDLRIVPNHTGWHPGLEGPFVLVQPEAGDPVVHAENRRSALFFHESEDVAAYTEAVEAVLEVAMRPAESAGRIEEIIDGLESTK